MNKLPLKDVKWLNKVAKFHVKKPKAPVIIWKTKITGKTSDDKDIKEKCIDEVLHLNINFYTKHEKNLK